MNKWYVVYNPQGGTEGHSQQYATNLCEGLVDIGIAVTLVTSQDFDDRAVIARGVEVIRSNIANSRKRTVRYDSWVSKLRYGAFIVANNFRSFFELTRVLSTHRPDACVLAGGETLTNILYLWFTYWRHRTVFALTIHNADYDISLYRHDKVKLIYKAFSKFLLKTLFRTCVVVFVHGEAMRDALAEQLEIKPEKISVYKVPTKDVVRVELDADESRDHVKLLFCGLVRHDKGFDLLCEALSRCTTSYKWQLRIAGSVKQVGEGYVYDLTRKFGIDAHCSYYLKYMSSSEIGKEFQKADIVVLPYRRGFIAQSVVMTDAIRWGKPVIVSEHSQNGYDAKRYGLGWTFKSEDLASLISTLNTAIAETHHRKNSYGFKKFMEAHAPSTVASSIVVAMSKHSHRSGHWV